jgi:hypothetical protein
MNKWPTLAVAAIIGLLGFIAAHADATKNLDTQPVAGYPGGATPYHLLSAATTNSTIVKVSPGTLYTISAINTTATVYYLKFYNSAGSPSCGSTAVVQTFPIPASTSGDGLVLAAPVGITFTAGISLCIVGGLLDTDTSSAATGVAISLSYY